MTIRILRHGLVLAAMLGSTPAFAAPILYTETAIGSGTFGGTAFSDALVTLSFAGDTNGIQGSPGYYENTLGTATISVAGLGSTTLTGGYVFVNQDFAGTGAAGFATADGGILETFNDAFKTYGLDTNGAETGASLFRPDLDFSTGLGGFNLQSVAESTFSTTISAVPLPASLPLFGAAVLVLGVASVARHRRA